MAGVNPVCGGSTRMTTVASVYASGLVKTFGELRGVDDIDLNRDVKAGDRLGVQI